MIVVGAMGEDALLLFIWGGGGVLIAPRVVWLALSLRLFWGFRGFRTQHNFSLLSPARFFFAFDLIFFFFVPF